MMTKKLFNAMWSKTSLLIAVSTTLFLGMFLRANSQTAFYGEAPILADLVSNGALPPVDERMPNNPMVVTPYERVGNYGGTWNMAMVSRDLSGLLRTIGYENLVRWDSNWTRVIPNLAQSYEASEDATTYTFRLREGLRWSDGMPFTADDIMFWYEAVYSNTELNPGGTDGLTVEKTGDYELLFRFNSPRGIFLESLCDYDGLKMTWYPRHYFEQFHKDYNSAYEQRVAEAGFQNWTEAFSDPAVIFAERRPTLHAWIVDEAYDDQGNFGPIVRAVRNPYYWKIDTEFNQLPYIDTVEFTVVQSRDEILPMVLAGSIDMQDRNIVPAAALPENQSTGGYGLYALYPSFSNYLAISFNQTHTDPVKREIFQNRYFRIAMSYAINRPAIIEATGLDVDPMQVAPLPGTPFYSEQMATQYLDYDVEVANTYLDQAGYSQRDAEGFRLGPDGERIRFTILVPSALPVTDFSVHTPQIVADWRAVGMDVSVESIPRNDYNLRAANNDFDVAFFHGEGGFDGIQTPRHFVPIEGFWSQQGVLWSYWALGLPEGEEPPPRVRETIGLYQQILETTDVDEQHALMREIIAIATEEFHVIGIHEFPVTYGVIRPNFHNVPELMFLSSNYFNPAPTNPCQYFIFIAP